MTASIPEGLSEAANGVLMVMYMAATLFFVLYLIREWRTAGNGDGVRPRWARFRNYENKAATALMTLGVGMSLKQAASWYALHLHNHGLKPNFPVLTPTFICGTLIATWGLMCLIGSISRYDWPHWTWVWIAVVAISFGVYFAL